MAIRGTGPRRTHGSPSAACTGLAAPAPMRGRETDMATVVSKRYDAAAAKIAPGKLYSLEEAVEIIKSMPPTKFDQSVDLSFRLGVDPKHADQMVRGAVVLPHGIGKSVRVAVFAKGDKEREAREGGPASGGEGAVAGGARVAGWEWDPAVSSPT